MRLSSKLLVISEAVLLVTVLALLLPLWFAMRSQIVESMQNELKAIASTGALAIDGDLHETIRGADDAGTPNFQMLRDRLDAVREANEVRWDHMYTFFRDGDQMRFAVMLHETPFVGDPYPIQPLMRPVLEEGTMEATELYRDEYGQWISAYAPIRDASGAVVGLLEVDKNSDEYFAEFRALTMFAAAIGLIALLLSSLLGFTVLRHLIIGPLGKIREAMVALGRHDFRYRVQIRTGDELQELGDTFNQISQQLDVAHVIQAGFFPQKMPTHEAYSVAGESVPCDATGGDYFDAFELEGGRVGVVVADVSGHGLGPSLLMATCRSALRALSHTPVTPGELVDRLNEILIDDLQDGRFITMIYGVFENDGRFTYANAGHGPALFLQNGDVLDLDPHRPPLGIEIPMDDDEPMQTSIDLAPGDRVLLASDGLPEAMDASGAFFGAERVATIASDRSLDSEGVVQSLRAALLGHCGGPSRTDDVTILCVDRV